MLQAVLSNDRHPDFPWIRQSDLYVFRIPRWFRNMSFRMLWSVKNAVWVTRNTHHARLNPGKNCGPLRCH